MQSKIPHYPVLICGATAVGLGIASELAEKVFIVERTGLVAKEFVDCYHPGGTEWNAVSPHGEKLKSELLQRNILDENGNSHIPAAASILFKLIQDTGINTLFVTEIIKIKKALSCYEITLYNNSGFQQITADQIIDTTVLPGSGHPLKEYISSMSLNAILHSKEETNFPFHHPDMVNHPSVSFQQGRFPKEIILKCSPNLEDDWITARHKLHSYWQNRPSCLEKWKIASVASTFDITLKEKVCCDLDDNRVWKPSCGYSNLLDAFEAGLQFGEELKGGV